MRLASPGESPLPPPYEISSRDVAKSRQAWSHKHLGRPHLRLLHELYRSLDPLLLPTRKKQENLTTILEHGGSYQGDQLRALLGRPLDEFFLAMGALTGTVYNRVSLKTYGAAKEGLGLHRDLNHEGQGKDLEVLNVPVRGVGRFGLWVVPETCQVDSEAAFGLVGADRERPLIVEVDGHERSLYPVDTLDLRPGAALFINESAGVGAWEGDGGHTELWHSVHRIGTEPRHVFVLRADLPKYPHIEASIRID